MYQNEFLICNHLGNCLQHNSNGLSELVGIVGFVEWWHMDEQGSAGAAVQSPEEKIRQGVRMSLGTSPADP